jgi:YD repeat-containing protein
MAKAKVLFQKRAPLTGRDAQQFLLAITSILTATPALADGLVPPTPFEINVRAAGKVNVVTDMLSMDHLDILVGSKDNGSEIALSRNITSTYEVNQTGWSMSMFGFGNSSSLHSYIDPNLSECCQYTTTGLTPIKGFANGNNFIFSYDKSQSSPTYIDNFQKGMSITVDKSSASMPTYRIRDGQGNAYIFICNGDYVVDSNPILPGSSAGTYNPVVYWISEIDYADGRRETFKYEVARSSSTAYTAMRLRSISNSQGYGLIFNYANPNQAGIFDYGKFIISQIDAVSASCDISQSSCSPTVLKSSYYYYNNTENVADGYGNASPGRYLYKFKDYLGNYINYNRGNTVISSGSNSYNDIEFSLIDRIYTLFGSQNDGELDRTVYQVKDAKGNIFQFDYDIQNTFVSGVGRVFNNTMTITDPSGKIRKYKNSYNLNARQDYSVRIPNVNSVTDENNYITSYGYDTYGRLTSITRPDGNVESQTLDSRGNPIESRIVAKPGSGLSDLVVTRSYPTCDTSNFRICNKPSYVIDAKGNRTDYTYYTAHGGIWTETGPADAAGNNLQTTYQYASFTGVDGAVFYKLSSKTTKLSASSSTTWSYTYDASNHWALKQVSETGGSTTFITCLHYNDAGQLLSKTAPRAGLQVCS